MHSIYSSLHSPFLRPYSHSPADLVGDGVMNALWDRGVHELSSSAVARAMRVTPQGLQQRLSRCRTDEDETTAAVLFRLASWALASRWVDWVRESLMVLERGKAPEVRLPATEDERLGVAVWLAWQEVARGRTLVGDTVPGEVMSSALDEERQLVRDALCRAAGGDPTEQQVLAVTAVADGLRSQLVWPGSTLPLAVAREVMARQVATVVNDVTRSAA